MTFGSKPFKWGGMTAIQLYMFLRMVCGFEVCSQRVLDGTKRAVLLWKPIPCSWCAPCLPSTLSQWRASGGAQKVGGSSHCNQETYPMINHKICTSITLTASSKGSPQHIQLELPCYRLRSLQSMYFTGASVEYPEQYKTFLRRVELFEPSVNKCCLYLLKEEAAYGSRILIW